MDEKRKVSTDDKYTANLAVKWKEKDRKDVAREVCQAYRQDKLSRKSWEDNRAKWFKLWLGIRDKKDTPWENASNVNLPLLAIACNQFHARCYQSFFSPPQMVKAYAVGGIADLARARHVEDFMNWQVMEDMDDYEEEKDKLLLNVPISGTQFTKGYYDRDNERPVCDYVSGMDVILPYRTKNLRSARRVTHANWIHYDELKRRYSYKKKFFVDFDKVQTTPAEMRNDNMEQVKDKIDTDVFQTEDKPKLILEQHTWYKAPGDDQEKPYIFWVDYDSETLLRATSRLMDAGNHQVVAEYFVDYHFLPNPEGYYSLGFGHFLQDLNEMANTAFNQIFDAGKLSNLPFGFYGRRAGVKKKTIKLYPGLMQEVEDATQVYFPAMQRVDQVLFQVLGVIQQYSESFTSTSDYLMGREAKGVKTPTKGGTEAIIEQGLVMYSVMIKRLFRSLKKEFKMIYMINQLHLPETKQYRVMESKDDIAFPTIKRKDFEAKLDVIPYGDPSYASKLTRRQEAMEIYNGLMNNPLVGVSNPQLGPPKNPDVIYKASKIWLETYGRKDIDDLMPDLPPKPIPPETENAMFMQGDTHDPMPGDDQIAHLKSHLAFKQSIFYGEMLPEYRELLDKHILKTKAMIYQIGSMRQQFAAPGAIPPPAVPQPPAQPPMGQPPIAPAPAGAPMPQGGINGQADGVNGVQPGGAP
jgi:chaperonin GroES